MNTSSYLRRFRSALLLAATAASLAGCYLLDSAGGQLALMAKRRPIDRVLRDPSISAVLRGRLEAVSSIRDFATRELGLPDNGSYRSYADVGRPYVVWNVIAAPEFSVDAEEWCYPVVGCVTYRGYFDERKARNFAAAEGRKGMDVSVGGVAAYSTLGHFDDPVLNTMMGWSDVELAAIIFHELTHQLLYLPGDTRFNEALATAVEEEGVRRWLRAQGRDADLEAHVLEQRQFGEVVDLLRRTRTELDALYASGASPADLRRAKQAAFARLRADYGRLTAGWRRAPFRDWFAGEINNAHLASVATYYDCVPGFERELASSGGDLRAFYARVHALARLDRPARDASVCGA